MENVIDDKTKVSLFAIIISVPVFTSLIFWLASVAANAQKGAEAKELCVQIQQDVAVIKADVKFLIKDK